MTVLSEDAQHELVQELLEQPVEDVLDQAAAAETWEDAWPYLMAIATRGTDEAFEAAADRTAGEDPRDRAIGADAVGRFAEHTPEYVDQALEVLTGMLDEGEEDPEVLTGVLGGLSWLAEARALDYFLRFVDHEDPAVRYGVAIGVPTTLDPEDPDPDGVDALMRLARDSDADVRDFATTALGSHLQIDTPDLRAALAERLTDEHFDTACEALVGLARRGDNRVLPIVTRILTVPEEERVVSTLQVQAAGLLGHPRLHPHLIDLRSWWDVDPDLLEWAIKRCAPRGGSRAIAARRTTERSSGQTAGGSAIGGSAIGGSGGSGGSWRAAERDDHVGSARAHGFG